MSPIGLEGEGPAGSFPRMSGDEPNWLTLLFNFTVFSPHERG